MTRAQLPTPFDPLLACGALDELLLRRIQYPEEAERIDTQIRTDFERTVAPFVLDMSGFSKLTARHGIIHYLSMVRRMRHAVEPIVREHSGMVVKFEADNAFCVFESADQAVRAAIQIRSLFADQNQLTPDALDIHISIGIGWGPVLLACDDLYGNELNLASKLGEDVAERDEILITDAARQACTTILDAESVPVSVSGVDIIAWRIR